jgi:CDGSH-type Zn-finger protein
MTTITFYEDACAVIKAEENIKVVIAGEETDSGKNQVAICRCMKSANLPFCDGSHKKDPKSI